MVFDGGTVAVYSISPELVTVNSYKREKNEQQYFYKGRLDK